MGSLQLIYTSPYENWNMVCQTLEHTYREEKSQLEQHLKLVADELEQLQCQWNEKFKSKETELAASKDICNTLQARYDDCQKQLSRLRRERDDLQKRLLENERNRNSEYRSLNERLEGLNSEAATLRIEV